MVILDIFKISTWKGLFAYFVASHLVDREKYLEAINVIISLLSDKRNYVIESHYYILGRAYLGIKDYKKAEKSFLISIENSHNRNVYKANTHFLLGLTYYEMKKFQQAIIEFQLAAEIKKDIRFKRDFVISLAHIYCYLCRAYKNLGQRNKSLEMIEQGFSYEPNNEALHRELIILKQNIGNSSAFKEENGVTH